MKSDLVLDVQVGAPVADFGRASELGQLENGGLVVVVGENGLLRLGDEGTVGRRRNAGIRTVCKCRASLCDRVRVGEGGKVLRRGV